MLLTRSSFEVKNLSRFALQITHSAGRRIKEKVKSKKEKVKRQKDEGKRKIP